MTDSDAVVKCDSSLCEVSVPSARVRDFGFVTVAYDDITRVFCSIDCASYWITSFGDGDDAVSSTAQ